jgi:hypothetical protein
MVYPIGIGKKCRIMPGSFNTTHWLILETTRYMLNLYGGWVIPLGRCLVISGVLIFNRTESYRHGFGVR